MHGLYCTFIVILCRCMCLAFHLDLFRIGGYKKIIYPGANDDSNPPVNPCIFYGNGYIVSK